MTWRRHRNGTDEAHWRTDTEEAHGSFVRVSMRMR